MSAGSARRGLRYSSEAALPASMRARLAAQRGDVPPAGKIVIDIATRAPLQNEWQRMHWTVRRKVCRLWAELIFTAYPHVPAAPIAKCRITIERFSTQKPDRDGLYGGLKPILDALQPASKRHPYGLGFIVDDNDDCVIDLKPIHVKGRDPRTRITIEPVDE